MYYRRKVALYTLGCKLNFSETSAIARALGEHGYLRVEFSDRADFYIINTCSVTENAENETRKIIKTALKINPDAHVVVIGCYAQLKPKEIAQIPGVSMVLGASEKFRLHEHLDKLENATETIVLDSDIEHVKTFHPAYSYGERTRSFLKVQDGCDYHCSFCTIPLARGASRSSSIADTLAVAQKVAATGVKEVVLTGVNLGDFGKTPDGTARTHENFYQLLCALQQINEIKRWRISSIEPNLLTDEIIHLVAQSRTIMPHFHIPLQSGNNFVLKKMRRKYLRELYAEKVNRIRQLIPHACIGVDVIVGFPGEGEKEFLDTYHFIHSLEVSYLHVFTYSERANTRAAQIDGVVPVPVRKERNRMLRDLSDKKKRAFYEAHAGEIRPVLFEAENDNGYMYGFTDNYIKVAVPYSEQLVNTICDVELCETDYRGYVRAILVECPVAQAQL
ncbi:MAG: tRNA (N(6)-L-threonylcarbamoyladenosine(37)-C(2))-methylthiotransferase MtaB [Chitinophagales bacterium]|nr:tRNA (N(6)-L-threonylcarbamoyladenosine(37)-C(2))-methylthiotransferase MtaB [Chitinophagales bacterium]